MRKVSLTDGQYRTLEIIVDLFVELGVSPTWEMIAEKYHGHRNTIKYNVDGLVDKGCVKIVEMGKTGRILPTPNAVPELALRMARFHLDQVLDYLKSDQELPALLDSIEKGAEAVCKLNMLVNRQLSPVMDTPAIS